MAICKEKNPMIDLLKDAEFLPVLLPRKSLTPLIALELTDKGYSEVGNIKEFIQEKEPHLLPVIKKNEAVPENIKGKLQTKVKTKTALEFMQKWIAAMKGVTAKLNYDYANSETVEFSFKFAKRDSVDKIKVSKYLNNGVFDTSAPDYLDKLKKGKIYLIVATLKSDSFSAKTFDKFDKVMQVKISEENTGGIDIQNESGKENSFSLLYRGKEELTFAVQICKILYDNDKGIFSLTDTKRDVVFGDEKIAVEYLKVEENFIEM